MSKTIKDDEQERHIYEEMESMGTHRRNRMILRKAMLAHGFKPLDSEWWHFTLKDEPFPDTYFTFPVKQLNWKWEG